MYILIYGGHGWIGSQFVEFIEKQGVSFIHGQERVDNIRDLIDEIDRIKPTHIISLIGRTFGTYKGILYNTIDFLEQPGNLSLNIRDNLFAPFVLATCCKERKIHFTYLGTGCIF